MHQGVKEARKKGGTCSGEIRKPFKKVKVLQKASGKYTKGESRMDADLALSIFGFTQISLISTDLIICFSAWCVFFLYLRGA